MANIYAPVMRALVVAALALATATLMVVAVNTARASGVLTNCNHISSDITADASNGALMLRVREN